MGSVHDSPNVDGTDTLLNTQGVVCLEIWSDLENSFNADTVVSVHVVASLRKLLEMKGYTIDFYLELFLVEL